MIRKDLNSIMQISVLLAEQIAELFLIIHTAINKKTCKTTEATSEETYLVLYPAYNLSEMH